MPILPNFSYDLRALLKSKSLRTEQIQPVCALEQNFADLY